MKLLQTALVDGVIFRSYPRPQSPPWLWPLIMYLRKLGKISTTIQQAAWPPHLQPTKTGNSLRSSEMRWLLAALVNLEQAHISDQDSVTGLLLAGIGVRIRSMASAFCNSLNSTLIACHSTPRRSKELLGGRRQDRKLDHRASFRQLYAEEEGHCHFTH